MAVMTKDDFITALRVIEARPTLYNCRFPYNLCYFTGEYITADCWNLGKAVIWSRGTAKDNYVYGNYYYLDSLRNVDYGIIEHYGDSGLGDWDAVNIFNNCATYRSTNWSELINSGVGGEWIRMNNEHMGYHIGGGIVIESTPIWEDGVQYTRIGPSGERISAPEYGSQFGGYWTEWCRMAQIDYGSTPTPPGPTPTPSKKIDVDGEFGSETVRLAQYALSLDHPYIVDFDGVVSGQEEALIRQWVPSFVQGAWEFSSVGSPTVKAIQEVCAKNGFYTDIIDGIWGQNTSKGLQMFLNARGASLDVDGEFGPLSTKAYQTFLNTFVD